MNFGEQRKNATNRVSYGNPNTGNMKAYSNNGLNHDKRATGLNHQTHPDRLQHRQTDKFGRQEKGKNEKNN